ncbi:MAG: hypothetical protein K0U29_09030 [Gammaproteobacteria bacterium]|nr:hypothetical protein [Gammaproteobacteria bacterium]MCH9745057.1 hypothetical protein [Gammaproteobacteria bacterium]
MAKEIPSYKNRVDRICNKVQRMVHELESDKENKSNSHKNKKSFKQVVQDILTDTEELSDT